jgi:hypothetical protein
VKTLTSLEDIKFNPTTEYSSEHLCFTASLAVLSIGTNETPNRVLKEISMKKYDLS